LLESVLRPLFIKWLRDRALVPAMGLCDVVQVGLMGFMAMMQSANCMVVVGSSVTHIPNITG
jgi:hypothetical protein